MQKHVYYSASMVAYILILHVKHVFVLYHRCCAQQYILHDVASTNLPDTFFVPTMTETLNQIIS